MPKLDDAGLHVDTIDEIVEGFDTDFRKEFGDGPEGIDLSPKSFTGRQNSIIARRLVTVQQLAADVLTMLSPSNASGRHLDFIGTLLGEKRGGKRRASIPARCHGKPGTVIGDRRVRYLRNNTIWRVPPDTVIGENGHVDVTLQANTAGTTREDGLPIEAFADGSDQWVIVDGIVGFIDVESTADSLAGADIEGPASYRARLRLAGRSAGKSTEPGVRRSIYAVAGPSALVDNNRKLGPSSSGVPGKSVEVVVDQGNESAIAQAIYDSFSDTADFHGTTEAIAYRRDPLTDELMYDAPVAVRYTPAVRVRVLWDIIVDTTNAEAKLPDNAEQLIIGAVERYTNETLVIGRNVVPEEAAASIRSGLPPGSVPQGQLNIKVGLVGAPLSTNPIVITTRQRARTDAAPQSAEVVGSNKQPFNVTVGNTLQLAVDGGAPQVVTLKVSDFGVVSQASALEIATAINSRTTGIDAGTEDGALVIRAESTGTTSMLQIGGDAALLSALGISPGIYTGSDGDITVLIA